MMNEQTIRFHLENIEKNNRFLAHKKEIEAEISGLRLLAFCFKGNSLGVEYNLKANSLEKKLKESELKRLTG